MTDKADTHHLSGLLSALRKDEGMGIAHVQMAVPANTPSILDIIKSGAKAPGTRITLDSDDQTLIF